MRCSAVLCDAAWCRVLQCTAMCWGLFLILSLSSFEGTTAFSKLACCWGRPCVLQCVAVCCSVLQCVAVCCSVLQYVAACWSVLQCVAVCVAVCYNVLQCVKGSFSFSHTHLSKEPRHSASWPAVMLRAFCNASRAAVAFSTSVLL